MPQQDKQKISEQECRKALENFVYQHGDMGARLLSILSTYITHFSYSYSSMSQNEKGNMLQEISIKLLRRHKQLKGNCTEWLYTIVRNEYTDYLRKQGLHSQRIITDHESNLIEADPIHHEQVHKLSRSSVQKLKVYPEEFPEAWASDWGEDEYGIWMGFNYRSVKYAFRWIEPNEFLMGSPEDEPGRMPERELQHEVKITQGFWLGETTVTQKLWEIIMDENPSRFKGENRPVERVSWEEAKRFIDKMNGMKAELRLCLPTEAQWEYACRADTTTAFHFGGKDDLTLDRVNYSGKWNATNFDGETKEVKSYNPNDWGLYEMHGNVLEWCNDWYGDYLAEQVSDPTGSETGTRRMLRGGSWFNSGRYCRSADRVFSTPDYSYNGIGFRLARYYA